MSTIILKSFTRALSANQRIRIDFPGQIFKCIQSAAIFDIKPDNGNKVSIQQGIGFKFTGQNIKQWEIINGTTAQTVTFYIADGEVTDDRVTGGISLKSNGSSTFNTVTVAATATLILAQNTNRSNILIVNNGGVTLYIGTTSSVTTANGIPVLANGAITLTVNDDIYGIATSGTLDIRYLEEVV